MSIVQNPTLSLADDVAATRRILHAQDRAGDPGRPLLRRCCDHRSRHRSEGRRTGLRRRVRPGSGGVRRLPHQGSAPGAPVPPILPPQNGYLFLDKAKFHASFAADVDADRAAFMADSQVPWGVEALSGAISAPAWKTKPSWYLVATEDRMIPPPAQRVMAKRAGSTVVEERGSHAIYVSQPGAVAALIAAAARSVGPAAR